MKSVVFQSPNAVDLIETDIPVPPAGWARIQVRAAAICRTDFEVLQGRIRASYPVTPGHEWSGIVDAVGSPSDELWIGRRVTGDNEITCLHCSYCRKGEWRRCSEYRQLGFDAAGAYAEYLLAPVHNLHELPSAVSFEQGCLMEPLAVGLAVVAMVQPQLGSTAVILGVGPIGLNCLAAMKAAGVTRIVCVDLREQRLKLALSWGAVAACKDVNDLAKAIVMWHPEGTDVVIDTTGQESLIQAGLASVRFGGTFVLAGYCGGGSMEIRPDVIHERNLRVLGAGNNCGFIAAAVRCVEDDILHTEEMITHRYCLEDYKRALTLESTAHSDYIKGIFTF